MTTIAGTKYVIIGAGIHGLSTAYHLALQLKATGKGTGEDILIVDKTAIGGGARTLTSPALVITLMNRFCGWATRSSSDDSRP